MQDILQSKTVKFVVLLIAGIILVFFIFGAGIFVGMKKADFSFKWAEAYHTNFGGPQEGFIPNFVESQQAFADPNGGFGTVIKKDANSITVHCDQDNMEKRFIIDNKTVIVCKKGNITFSDLEENDTVVVIGEPDSMGNIIARFVRACLTPMAKPHS